MEAEVGEVCDNSYFCHNNLICNHLGEAGAGGGDDEVVAVKEDYDLVVVAVDSDEMVPHLEVVVADGGEEAEEVAVDDDLEVAVAVPRHPEVVVVVVANSLHLSIQNTAHCHSYSTDCQKPEPYYHLANHSEANRQYFSICTQYNSNSELITPDWNFALDW